VSWYTRLCVYVCIYVCVCGYGCGYMWMWMWGVCKCVLSISLSHTHTITPPPPPPNPQTKPHTKNSTPSQHATRPRLLLPPIHSIEDWPSALTRAVAIPSSHGPRLVGWAVR
jgi:hypothetical protein